MNHSRAVETPLVLFMGCPDFALATGVALASLCRHFSGKTLEVLLLDYGMTAAQRERFTQLAGQQRQDIRLRWFNRPLPDHPKPGRMLGWICRDRISFLDEIAEERSRLLMMDADLLIESDITPLWQTDLQGHSLAAARDFAYPTMGLRFAQSPQPARPYYNIGVLLVDLVQWKQQALSQSCYLRWDGDAPTQGPFCPDQDAMNLALPDAWRELDPTWNAQMIALQHYERWPESAWKESLRPQAKKLYAHPNIRHWPGPYKPWQNHPGCDIPYQGTYELAVGRSGWLKPVDGLRWFFRGLARTLRRS